MNRIRSVFIVSLVLLVFTISSSFHLQEEATLHIHLKDLRNADGQIMLSLNRGPIDFPDGNYYKQKV